MNEMEVKTKLESVVGIERILNHHYREVIRYKNLITIYSNKGDERFHDVFFNSMMGHVDNVFNNISKTEQKILEVQNFISKLDRDIEKEVLTKRFLEGKSLYEIAADCKYSRRQIHRLIKSGIKNLSDNFI